MVSRDAALDVASLVKDHHAAVYRYAYRLTGKVTDAEDLTQQAYLLAQQKLAQLRDPASARAWLLAILRNCYLREHRKPTPVPATTLDFNIESVPQEVLSAEIDREQLQLALDELPAEFKVVLMMFYFEQRAYRDIAETLDLPLGTVMSRLSRAKNHLRARLFEQEAKVNAKIRATTTKGGRSEASERPLVAR